MKTGNIELLTAEARAEIDSWIARYPTEQRQSATMPALRIVQDMNEGHLTRELMDAVADYLGVPAIAVYEVATFYSMYEHKPVGRYKISVCTNISCMLCGSEEIVDYLEKRLGIHMGETTMDGRFTLKSVECLGACCGAPMFQIGRTYYENLTPEKVDAILAELR